MALVRLNGAVVSVSGCSGGNEWSRDSSGQHVIARQLHVRKEKSRKQLEQMAWYNQLKREERRGGPPGGSSPEPFSPSTNLVYQVLECHLVRQRSVFEPTITDVPEPPLLANEIDEWIIENWSLFEGIRGVTYNIVYRIFKKLFYRSMYSWGVWAPQAFYDTTVEMIKWAARARAIATIEVALANWLGLVILGVVVLAADFFSRVNLSSRPAAGESVMRMAGKLYWSRLVARPSKKMFDFVVGDEIFAPPLIQQYWATREGGIAYKYDWSGLPQVLRGHWGWWDSYGWDSIEIASRYPVYRVADGRYRCVMTDTDIWYYNVPVGWSFAGDPFGWVEGIYS